LLRVRLTAGLGALQDRQAPPPGRHGTRNTLFASIAGLAGRCDCSGFGGTGTFIADMISGSPSSLSYDDQPIANELGSGGSQTTTVYPQSQGGSYHLEVNSDCSWSITLTAG
jgi:hypothetical protein